VLVIHRVSIGTHALFDVEASAGPHSALLLPFKILNQMGRFTIDTQTGTLSFG
jgi:hypothetical protein